MADKQYREGIQDATLTVRTVYLLRAPFVGFDFKAGGMGEDTCIGHLTVVDAPNEQAFIVPVNRTGINALIGMMEKVLREAPEPGDADVQDA